MAKKFMFVCFGILALMVAFLLGAQFGRAEYVDHSTTGVISACAEGSQAYVLLDTGQAFQKNAFTSTEWESEDAPPIPISQLKFWNVHWCVTTSNEFWYNEGGNWRSLGIPPMGATTTHPSTWGGIKAQFK